MHFQVFGRVIVAEPDRLVGVVGHVDLPVVAPRYFGNLLGGKNGKLLANLVKGFTGE